MRATQRFATVGALLVAVGAILLGSGSVATGANAVDGRAGCSPADQQYGWCGTEPAQNGVSVSGHLTLDTFGNKLSIAAHSTASPDATGHAVFQNAGAVIRIRITCLIPLSESTVIVGGVTEGATGGEGTIFPFYTFVLEDQGVGQPDKYTIFAQVSGVCTEAFGPAVVVAAHGNIVIHSG